MRNNDLGNKVTDFSKYEYIDHGDLNTIATSGFYKTGASNSHTPVSDWTCDYSSMIVNAYSNTTVSQIFIARDSKAYYRVCNSGTWGAWFTIQTGVKYDSMNVTISNGDITLFDHKVEVIGIYVTNDTKYWAALPYFYGTTTCAKVFDFSVSTPIYATGSATIGIYYREWQ